MKRGPWRKKRNPLARPWATETPRSGAAWRLRCRIVRARDTDTCRRCGRPARGADGHVDHLIPRRLCPSPEVADLLENLGVLCAASCHPWKTGTLEPSLYTGRVQAFEEFLGVVATTGPIPPPEIVGGAYERLRASMERRAT